MIVMFYTVDMKFGLYSAHLAIKVQVHKVYTKLYYKTYEHMKKADFVYLYY